MEDRPNHRVQVTIAAIATALMLLIPPAVADDHEDEPFDWPSTITVETNPDAVVVESEVHGTLSGAPGVQAFGSGSDCSLRGMNISYELWQETLRRDNQLPYLFWCGDELIGLVWVTLGEDGEPAGNVASPEEVAMRLRDQIPIPNVNITMNPELGLVGMESWFWIEGYDGSPITDSTDAFGSLVEVEAQVLRYEWSFGDGSTLMGRTTGNPYPERSDIRHVYEKSSLGHPIGYQVEVAFVFSVRYRVDGGGWIELPGITRVAQAVYLVRESQAVIGR
jgi:hypothetical protein